MKNKQIHILGGGTLGSKSLPHLSLTAPAYGATAKRLAQLYEEQAHDLDVCLHLTKMAGGDALETNQDVEDFIDTLVADTDTKIIVMNAALCDFDMTITQELDLDAEANPVTGLNHWSEHKEERTRLSTRKEYKAHLVPAKKIINKIRKTRKDIFLVGFKTTFHASKEDMFQKGLTLMKKASCNLVLVNDIGTHTNFIITPEESSYSLGKSRDEVLKDLVEMSLLRSHLSFTRSTVVDAEPVPWEDPRVPTVLREVVNHCIELGAYKEGPTGATVGHFAVKLGDTEFLTSRRKVNFNQMAKVGLVRVKTDGPDSVIAYGSKPSVGGQSQRIVFQDHQGCDSIVHFHCPMLANPKHPIPVVSQREYECGSHECEENTSKGLQKFGNIWAVMLDKHGPNLVFDSRTTTKDEVIDFITDNFDLKKKTTGLEYPLGALRQTLSEIDR